ncbi:thioredoxin domain-containing protein [Haloferula sp. BvORR071]|uniref:thioredoxin family protein n=1 Tax=Haloferula sp. BvORR071 TaxID=1396141 RepID=UPI0009464F19|nr:thioredoxin domain-containing protein [Haloferula sp. BvORR071]
MNFHLPSFPFRTAIPAAAMAVALLALPACDDGESLTGKKTTPIAEPIGPKGSAEVRELDAAAFDQFTKTPGKLVVIDYYADWCGPCRELGPLMEEVAKEFSGRVVIGKVNVDKAKDLAQRAGVHGIPDVRLYRDGQQVDLFIGSMPAAEVRGKFAAYVPEKVAEPPVSAAAAEAQPAQQAPAVQPGMEKR